MALNSVVGVGVKKKIPAELPAVVAEFRMGFVKCI